MARHKDGNWNLTPADKDGMVLHSQIHMALLMDIRDELKALNKTLACKNFQSIPRTLTRLDKRMAKFSPLKKKQRKT